MKTRIAVLRLGSLLVATAIWGWSFVVVKDAVSTFPIAAFLAYRFALAVLFFAPFARAMRLRSVLVGSGIGVLLGIAFLLQTAGLHLTLAGDAGLVTGLFVVFVPIIEWFLFGTRLNRATLGALVLSTTGLLLLVGGLPRQLAGGDLLVAISALGYAVQIILISRLSPRHDAVSLTFGQIAGAAVIFALAALTPMGGGFSWPGASVLLAILITASLATTFALLIQVWAQRTLAPTQSAMILLTEPAWAVFFGVVLAGNPFPPIRLAGAALLLIAPMIATLAARLAGRPERAIRAAEALSDELKGRLAS